MDSLTPKTSIVFLLPNLQLGGAERQAINLISLVASQGGEDREVFLHILKEVPECTDQDIKELRQIQIYKGLSGLLHLSKKLRFSSNDSIKVIACTESFPALLGLILKLIKPASDLILWMHTNPIFYFSQSVKNKTFGLLWRIAAFFSSKIVCVSDFSQNMVMQFLSGYPDVRLTTIYNAIDDKELTDLEQVVVLSKRRNIPVVAYIGRISKEKGIDTYLRTAKELHQDLQFFVFTDLEGRDRLHNIYGEYCNNISIKTGKTKREIYEQIDIVIISSYTEGFSMVCLESIIARKKIIYRKSLDAVRELITNTSYKSVYGFGEEHEIPLGINSLIELAETDLNYPIDLGKYTMQNFRITWNCLLGKQE